MNLYLNQRTVLDYGQSLKDAGYSTKELGPSVSGVYDKTTGQFYYAKNARGLGEIPDPLHPLLESPIYEMPEAIENSYIATNGKGTHSEIYALNDLLWAHDKIDPLNPINPEDIMVYTNLMGESTQQMVEEPFETCNHCWYILRKYGIPAENIISDY